MTPEHAELRRLALAARFDLMLAPVASVVALLDRVEELEAALQRICDGAGSNTVSADRQPRDHEYGGIYAIARAALRGTP